MKRGFDQVSPAYGSGRAFFLVFLDLFFLVALVELLAFPAEVASVVAFVSLAAVELSSSVSLAVSLLAR